MEDIREALVLKRCQRGEEDGFREFFDMFRGYIHSLCFRMCGDREEVPDLCQECYLAIFRGIKGVRPDSPLKPWVRRVTLNVCLNYRRKLESRTALLNGTPAGGDAGDVTGSFVAAAASTLDGPAVQTEHREIRAALGKAIRALSPDQRLVVILFHQEGLSYQEISEETGWPVGTVKTNLFRARKALAESMNEWQVR